MNVKNLIGNTTSVPSIDFNQVVKCDNLRYWRISKATWEKAMMYESSCLFVENRLVNPKVVKAFNELKKAIEEQLVTIRNS